MNVHLTIEEGLIEKSVFIKYEYLKDLVKLMFLVSNVGILSIVFPEILFDYQE